MVCSPDFSSILRQKLGADLKLKASRKPLKEPPQLSSSHCKSEMLNNLSTEATDTEVNRNHKKLKYKSSNF